MGKVEALLVRAERRLVYGVHKARSDQAQTRHSHVREQKKSCFSIALGFLFRQGTILKSADSLVGEEYTFALFVPSKDPYFFKCLNAEQKSMWMGVLNKFAASTEWSTSSMVTKRKSKDIVRVFVCVWVFVLFFVFFFVFFFLFTAGKKVTAFVDPVVVASQEGIIIEVNDAMLTMFGYERSAVIGKTVDWLFNICPNTLIKGKNLKILMPNSIGQHHDGYLKAYLETGIAKLVGKPRALSGQHADGSAIPLILSLGVESTPQGKKTFIATLRRNTEKASSVPSKLELDAMMHKAVETTLQEASTKIKDSLSGELEQIMKRLEEYQASHKLLTAKALKEGSRMVSGFENFWGHVLIMSLISRTVPTRPWEMIRTVRKQCPSPKKSK